jgi:hypothetical protein
MPQKQTDRRRLPVEWGVFQKLHPGCPVVDSYKSRSDRTKRVEFETPPVHSATCPSGIIISRVRQPSKVKETTGYNEANRF